MNDFNRQVIERLGLTEEELKQIHYKSLNDDEFLPKSEILRNYKLYSTKEKELMVSLLDIVGFQTRFNLYGVMDTLFDPKGDGYHSRAVSLFDLTIDNFRKRLFPELSGRRNYDPFKVRENGEGKYEVDDGCHRFTFLKLLYLSELKKCNGDPEKIKELDEKFIIPAIIRSPIDFEKTYCNFILQNTPTIDIETGEESKDVSIKKVGTMWGEIYVKYSDGRTIEKVDDNRFIEFAKKSIIQSEFVNVKIINNYFEDEGFKRYIDENIPEIAEKLKNQKLMIQIVEEFVASDEQLRKDIFKKLDKMNFAGKNNMSFVNFMNSLNKIKEKVYSGKMTQEELTKIAEYIKNNGSKVIELSKKRFDKIYEDGIKAKVNTLIKNNRLDRIKIEKANLLINNGQGFFARIGNRFLSRIKLQNLDLKREIVTYENIEFKNKEEAIKYLYDYILENGANPNNEIDRELFEFINTYGELEGKDIFEDKENSQLNMEINGIEKKTISQVISDIRYQLSERKRLREMQRLVKEKNQEKKSFFKVDTTNPEYLINQFVQGLHQIINQTEKSNQRECENIK